MFEVSRNEARGGIQPLSVSQLTGQIKASLEGQFPRIAVIGEISNFKPASSGHWYFSLKDDQSQIKVNMWRSAAARVNFKPRDGMEVMLVGGLSLYGPRGEYNLIAERIEEVGLGKLRAEFERLKAKLRDEGLFQQEHKKPLPFLPSKVGVVTSPTGAAIRDILRVLHGRFPGLHVLIAPARVQGEGAAAEIAGAIRYLDAYGQCDVLIVGRGGGSEQDLWSFNEEVVARAIFAARTPIISAVGHEVDVTIADFVADRRAATPSNAAELVVRDQEDYARMIHVQRGQLDRCLQRRLMILRQRVKVSESHPIFLKIRSRMNDATRRLAELDARMARRVTAVCNDRRLRLAHANKRLQPEWLLARVRLLRQRLLTAVRDLPLRIQNRIERPRQRFVGLALRLDDLSPLKILSRGYAVVHGPKGKVVKRADELRPGELVRIQLGVGELRARVVERERAIQTSLFDSNMP